MPNGASICAVCGAVIDREISAASAPRLKSHRTGNASKRLTAGIITIITSGLTMILLFIFVLGPMISGRTIFGSNAPFDVTSTGSVVVSPENPIATIDGVTVDFGDNLTEEANFTITAGTQAPDNERYTGIDVYDFTLEGQKEFTTLVDITVPDTSGNAEAFYAAYYNDETGEWEGIPFEINEGEVAFSTRHFSKYGLIKYYRDRYDGPLTTVVVNYDEMRKAFEGLEDDGLFEKFLEEKGQTGSDAFINKALAVTSNVISLKSAQTTYQSIVAGVGDAAAKELADRLTVVGGAVTLLKVAYQWQAGDSNEKIIEDNIFNLCELTLGTAALAIPSSTILPVAAVGVFALGLAYDYVLVPAYEDDSLQYAYQAYYDYCTQPHIVYDKNRAKDLAAGSGDDSPWVARQTYNTNTEKWESAHTGAEQQNLTSTFSSKWEKALMDCYTAYTKNPKAMQERIDEMIDEYLDVFWALEAKEQVQFAKDYCGIDENNWRWPDVTETQQMKNAMKAELMENFLKPVFKDVQRTIVEELKATLFRETNELAKYLNTEISFVIEDPEAKKEGFENTRVAGDIIRIEPVADSAHQDDWICRPDSYSGDTVFACTLNSYIKEGCPNKVCFYKTETELKAGNPYMTMDLCFEKPVTRIVLGEESRIEGKYAVFTDFSEELAFNSATYKLLENMLYQLGETEVQKDGSFSVSVPAHSVTMKHSTSDIESDATVNYGTITLKGRIDPQTEKGTAEFSGTASGEWTPPDMPYNNQYDINVQYDLKFYGSMDVEYTTTEYNSINNGSLFFVSNPETDHAVKITGTYIYSSRDSEEERYTNTNKYDEKIDYHFDFIRMQL